MEKPYTLNIEQIAERLKTDVKIGLTSSEALNRIKEYGANVLKEAKGKNPLVMFLGEFTDFLVIILLIAAVVSFLFGERVDALMIIAIVIVNAIVGFIQKYRVEKAMEHLKKMVVSEVMIIRDEALLKIPSGQLVPGDLILIEEGQKVTADIRLTQSINLQTIEAALTGESTPISKIIEVLTGGLPIADQKNMLFSGTIVSSGKGMGIVVGTGMNTEIGRIAKMVTEEEDPQTPMQQKLDKLGAFIGKVILVIAALVAVQEMVFGNQQIIEALVSAVALAVAAIPEGLPAVVTISLALGTRRLLRQNALIRNLPAAETLGSTDVICSDKTGTLTEGVMSVRQIYVDGKFVDVKSSEAKRILEIGFLSSNARKSGDKIIGDTTEAALIQAFLNSGMDQDQMSNIYDRVSEIPFSSARKMMTIASKTSSQIYVTSKGATEAILSHCSKIEKNGKAQPITDEDKNLILKINDQMAANALRVLSFAYKSIDSVDEKNTENDLVFVGMQGLMDPPRKDVAQSIRVCQQQAGIRVVMITGDHLLTAQAIAKELGIAGKSITGIELDPIPDEEFERVVEDYSVYARVNPEHKIRIVKALKDKGHQVAMTGDGVNDAPALKASDIGIAMGLTGTDVAKDSSDMILLDDHFNTIVSAVQEGRAIYDNIRKFVNYLLSSNMMEVAVIFIALILGWPIPLLPIHLLWINLVTDGLPAIALGVDPARPNIMQQKPQLFREQIITKGFFIRMVIAATVLTIAILGIYGFTDKQLVYGQTMAFTAVVLYEMVRLSAIRSEYNLSILSNKFLVLAVLSSLALQLLILYLPLSLGGISLQTLFKVQPLSFTDWGILVGVGAILFIFMKLAVSFSIPKSNTLKGLTA